LVCRKAACVLSARFPDHAATNRRFCADQTRVRGGCSGGGWPKPSGQESFCGGAIWLEAANGWNVAADALAKYVVMHAAMKTHLSQSIGAGALAGQHGISPTISSAIAGIDISSDIDACEAAPALAGPDNGANTSPAIMKIASSRRMVIWRFTPLESHKAAQIDSLPRLTTP
jgi:hypothetical protein